MLFVLSPWGPKKTYDQENLDPDFAKTLNIQYPGVRYEVTVVKPVFTTAFSQSFRLDSIWKEP